MAENQLSTLEQHGLASLQVQEIRGRELVTPQGTFIDFCNTNYLSFDRHPLMLERGALFAERWGSLCGWSRLEADPIFYKELEDKIARFLGAPRVIISHTITLSCFSVLSSIVQKGTIFADRKVHTVVWEACRLSRDHGATLLRFEHQDMNDLERQLKSCNNPGPKLIVVDGVYSLSSALAPVAALQELARRYDAWLLIDDAHGFGLLGDQPSDENPFGVAGRGVVAYSKGDFKRTFYVSSFGKAFCTHTAFLTIPEEFEGSIPAVHLAHIFSAPVSPHTVGTVDAALDLNEKRGEVDRLHIRQLVAQTVTDLQAEGYAIENHASLPIVFIPIGRLEKLVAGAQILSGEGLLTGLRAFPIVRPDRCGVRVALTSSHTHEHVGRLVSCLAQPKLKALREVEL
ncbi:MAG: pyridoxal phosphate-dependent aminotransferase family protein [Bdellovibrionota bacterium]